MNLVFKNFINLSKDEHIKLLNIRNSDHVRVQTKSTNIVTLDNHLVWIEKLKLDKSNIYYAVKLNNDIVGSISIISINHDKLSCSWGIYFKQKINPIVSSISTYIIIDKIFNQLNMLKLNLEVMKENNSAYKFDLGFGFKVYKEDSKYYFMSMDYDDWDKNKNVSFLKLIKNKVNKIDYTFTN
ncbi:MAG: UDP-4-amino-4,6-dideoxy-N-acetyl-beta-L-altrosamine N-acetyltransferase [Campylobacterota bacterium]|nr:UDP-4-amino-4,6-dideoxy-N-acetyl-beta-L-altrosamine N-acetyltransferase [Campylobacterota bacterium]